MAPPPDDVVGVPLEDPTRAGVPPEPISTRTAWAQGLEQERGFPDAPARTPRITVNGDDPASFGRDERVNPRFQAVCQSSRR
jgi:hypothetical protein